MSANDWILDTGAIDHMVNSVSLFTTVSSVSHLSVKLPNGQTAVVTHIGTIHITSTLTLTNVLCIPSFSFNLISVHKLTKTLSCCHIFLDTLCFIQDLQNWKKKKRLDWVKKREAYMFWKFIQSSFNFLCPRHAYLPMFLHTP